MLSTGKRLLYCNNSKISARIPLQSPPEGGDSFPPGEAIAAAPLIVQTTTICNKKGRVCALFSFNP
jgi:hypothetical protein